MKKSHFVTYTFFIIMLLILLLFPSQSIQAGREGLLLWFNIIIPTLFPFMIISSIILHSPIIDLFNKLFTPLLKKLFGVSGVASYALIMGCLSGYPMGAIIVSDLVRTKKLSKGEATYLLTFCNNTSPMFVMGFVASSLLKNPKIGLPLLIIIYLGNTITAFIFKKIYKFKSLPTMSASEKNHSHLTFSFFDDCILKTAEVLVKVGGYIILFSLPVIFLSAVPIHNVSYHFLVSTIDLSNGVSLLSKISCTPILQASLFSALCAFGSLSVVGQTASVIKGSGLSIKKYFLAKIVNAVITFGCGMFLFSLIL